MSDVTVRAYPVVLLVQILEKRLPFGRKNALAPQARECEMETSETRKKVYEAKGMCCQLI